MKNKFIIAMAAIAAAGFAGNADALIEYDQNVTSNAIFGGGNTNGSYTTDRQNNVELGLRGKLRHNAAGAPENTFNSNGNGTYSFAAGVAPTQAFPTAVWSFEWSINVDLSGTSGRDLSDLTYVLGIDYNPSQGVLYNTFDPIHDGNPANPGGYWDHSIGDNGTGQGAGLEATNIPIDNTNAGTIAASHAARDAYYDTLINDYNLAQNSWKAHWYMPPGQFDPTVDGTYNFFLAAFDSAGNRIARTDIQIIVGQGGAPIPEPATMTLLGLGLAGLAVRARKGLKK